MSLSMWTVYDHPKDYPESFVARRQEVGAGVIHHTGDIILGDLAEIRRQLQTQGLVRLCRSPGDDPVIVEVWL